jgi:hypothetical protein
MLSFASDDVHSRSSLAGVGGRRRCAPPGRAATWRVDPDLGLTPQVAGRAGGNTRERPGPPPTDPGRAHHRAAHSGSALGTSGSNEFSTLVSVRPACATQAGGQRPTSAPSTSTEPSSDRVGGHRRAGRRGSLQQADRQRHAALGSYRRKPPSARLREARRLRAPPGWPKPSATNPPSERRTSS